ncbi:sigma-70 family RNA polymerase sigma factor [Micromonospora carbonacea]|uniref:sigma-70 family RNA polymerase sigma factor n=1 Tax=Micromonospora carbonacea TaxID=47853 RepID=UPI0037123EE5
MSTTTIDFDDLVREQRFDDMVRNDRARVVRIVYGYIGNWADAEEAVQETLIDMWADRVSLDRVADLTGWLVVGAKYRALTIADKRRKATPSMLGEHIERVESQHLEPTSPLCSGDPEVMARIRVALAAMTPTQRKAVQLHCLHGLTAAQTAAEMGTTKHAVHQLLYNALHHVDLNGPEWTDRQAELGMESPEAKAFRACPQLLRMLPPRQRQAVQLRYVKGLPVAEVAKRMRITNHDAANHINRARRAVRELVGTLPATA